MFSKTMTTKSTRESREPIERLKHALDGADAIVIGAGAGLSTSAGFVYSGERFQQYFSDFGEKYGFQDMYSGGFYPYRTPNDSGRPPCVLCLHQRRSGRRTPGDRRSCPLPKPGYRARW